MKRTLKDRNEVSKSRKSDAWGKTRANRAVRRAVKRNIEADGRPSAYIDKWSFLKDF